MRELPSMEYPQTKSCVYPQQGWQEDRAKLLRRSGTVPSQVILPSLSVLSML